MIAADVIYLEKMGKDDPYVGQACNLIKYSNKLAYCPPMHGLYTPGKIIVYIAAAEYLDDVYINKNKYYTKD